MSLPAWHGSCLKETISLIIAEDWFMTSFPHRYLHGVIETSCICELMSALPQIPKAHRRLQLFKVHYPVKTTLISFSRRSMLRLESDQAVHTCDVQLFSC